MGARAFGAAVHRIPLRRLFPPVEVFHSFSKRIPPAVLNQFLQNLLAVTTTGAERKPRQL